jgi:hypothetical protein
MQYSVNPNNIAYFSESILNKKILSVNNSPLMLDNFRQNDIMANVTKTDNFFMTTSPFLRFDFDIPLVTIIVTNILYMNLKKFFYFVNTFF